MQENWVKTRIETNLITWTVLELKQMLENWIETRTETNLLTWAVLELKQMKWTE